MKGNWNAMSVSDTQMRVHAHRITFAKDRWQTELRHEEVCNILHILPHEYIVDPRER